MESCDYYFFFVFFIFYCEIDSVPDMCKLCVDMHKALAPHVPIAGWDITELDDGSLVFLETNLSANLHKGYFDRQT